MSFQVPLSPPCPETCGSLLWVAPVQPLGAALVFWLPPRSFLPLSWICLSTVLGLWSVVLWHLWPVGMMMEESQESAQTCVTPPTHRHPLSDFLPQEPNREEELEADVPRSGREDEDDKQEGPAGSGLLQTQLVQVSCFPHTCLQWEGRLGDCI